MKICKDCKIEKELIYFRTSKRHIDGYMNDCKECISIKRRKYYLNNIEKHKINSKEYYENNKESIYNKIDKDKKRENNKRYREKNIEKLRKRNLEYYYENRESILEDRKEYYENNKKELNKTSERKREIRRKSYKKRKHQYIWREILRKTITQLKLNKSQTTEDMIGYSYTELKYYIESKFDIGMSWDNHGEWHVDHIIPISLFKEGTDPSIVNKLNNLRPMWAIDNIKKSNKLEIENEHLYLIEELSEFIINDKSLIISKK